VTEFPKLIGDYVAPKILQEESKIQTFLGRQYQHQ